MSRPRLIALLLAFATLVVFLPAGRFNFLNYDDNDYITDNAFVKHGVTWSGVRTAFTTFHASNWHPLTWLSHMADCTLFGLNPGAHHFVNVLFHAANAALLFGLLFRLTEKLWPAALIAALFAWHPLHVESVAWISERKDVLSTFFALLTLLAYAKYAGESQAKGPLAKRFYIASLASFALGLLAKPMLVTLPFVLLLLDFWPLKRLSLAAFRLPLLLEKIPFFILAAGSCIVTFLAQRSGEAVVSLAKVSLRYRLENAPVAMADYLLKFFWPADLCAIYPMQPTISATEVALAVSVLLLVSLAAWHGRNTRPYFLVGWLWFLGTLVPVIGLVQVGGAAMADRYTYIPSIGFFIALVFLSVELMQKLSLPKMFFAGFSVLILVACICATEFQLQFWRDSETLFRRTIAVTRDNDIALVNLGVALEAQNRQAEALGFYQQAEKIARGRHQIHTNLGNLLSGLGRHVEALAEYREAFRLRPGSAELQNSIGGELATLGRFDEAMKELAAAEKLDTQYAWPHVQIAKVFFQLGRDADAVDELRAALRLEPDSFEILATTAHYLAANEDAAARDGRSALVLATKANVLANGSQPMVFDVLGMACAEVGDFTNAQTCAENALTLATAARMKNLESLQQRLELYKNHQPWRESFRATNAPVKN